MTTDWVAWHTDYDDPGSALSQRLSVVRSQIGRWLDETAPRPVTVVSICSGDARDVLGALARRADAARVGVTLVELDPQLCRRAEETASASGLTEVNVRCADAGDLTAYAGCPPADLVLVCGVFGNISAADTALTVARLHELCAEDARVIWTRCRRGPDVTPAIRTSFDDNGFREVAFLTPGDTLTAVGVHDLVAGAGRSIVDRPDARLFRFQR